MRSIKLIPALAAAASLLALAPAQSYARPRAHKHAALHHRHAVVTRACRLTLEAPTIITAGEKAEVFLATHVLRVFRLSFGIFGPT